MDAIVIIEDDFPTRELLALALRKLDADIHNAGNADTGLRLIRSVPTGLVILDLHLLGAANGMPSGYDVLAVMQGDPLLCDIPVLIISSDSRMSKEAAAQIGCAGFMLKPFKPTHLRERAAELLAAFAGTPVTTLSA